MLLYCLTSYCVRIVYEVIRIDTRRTTRNYLTNKSERVPIISSNSRQCVRKERRITHLLRVVCGNFRAGRRRAVKLAS